MNLSIFNSISDDQQFLKQVERIKNQEKNV